MKRLVCVLMVLGMMGITACGKTESAPQEVKQDAEVIIAIGLQYVTEMVVQQYDSLQSNYTYTSTMQIAAEKGQLQQAYEEIYQQYGQGVSLGQPVVTEQNPYRIVGVPVQFEKGQANVNVVFDDKEAIAGVNLGAYTEETEDNYVMSEEIEEIQLDLQASQEGALPGILTLPKDREIPLACVVLVHGSGANDADETIYQNKPFRDIAHGLAQQGIAVYRYDKRTKVYPQQMQENITATLDEETINDAIDAVKMLSQMEQIDSQRIVVLGHSLGGYAIPRIAAKTDQVEGYVIMAGNARGLEVLLPLQVEYLAHLDGTMTQDEQETIDMIQKELAQLEQIDQLPDDTVILGAYKGYYQDLLQYNPLAMAQNIQVPVLVLQGDRDYQVTVDDFELWKDASKGKSNWSFQLYSGLNHLMMQGEGPGNPAEYMIPSYVDQRVIDDIAVFVKGI